MSDAQAPAEDAPPAGEEETVAVVAEGGDQDEAVEEDVMFSVSVLEVVRTAQNLKGLRDADYMRYRSVSAVPPPFPPFFQPFFRFWPLPVCVAPWTRL